MKKINDQGLNIIKTCEGCRLHSYKDTGGVWTIGVGHTGKDVVPDMTITQDKADEYLKQDIEKTEIGVDTLLENLGISLNDNQFSALVSLAYNIGVNRLSRSSIISSIENDEYKTAANLFKLYVHDRLGKELPGLVKRRNLEMELFLS